MECSSRSVEFCFPGRRKPPGCRDRPSGLVLQVGGGRYSRLGNFDQRYRTGTINPLSAGLYTSSPPSSEVGPRSPGHTNYTESQHRLVYGTGGWWRKCQNVPKRNPGFMSSFTSNTANSTPVFSCEYFEPTTKNGTGVIITVCQ